MLSVVLGLALFSAAEPQHPPLSEAEHALAAGRVEQARIMIGNAVKAGAQGPEVDRLLADLAFVSEDFGLALVRYDALLRAEPGNAFLAERAGIAALKLGDWSRGRALLYRATTADGTSWRAWNALGVAADHFRDTQQAERAYARAAQLSPDRPEILNNMGWSLLLQGRWEEGHAVLERASVIDPGDRRIADNLELARLAVSADLPARRPRESDEEWAARLNDAGVVALARGERARAVAAFSRAIEARSDWFEKAANNLALAQERR